MGEYNNVKEFSHLMTIVLIIICVTRQHLTLYNIIIYANRRKYRIIYHRMYKTSEILISSNFVSPNNVRNITARAEINATIHGSFDDFYR